MRGNKKNIFMTVKTEGGLLPADLLQKIAVSDKSLDGLSLESYHLNPNERINEAASRSWNRLLNSWQSFRKAAEELPETERGTTVTRERWLLILFQELGYGRLSPVKAMELNGRTYPISHFWKNSPIHLVGYRIDIDKRASGIAGAARTSPHSLVQEFLNASDKYLWGFVSNGLCLRILRDNRSLTRQAYVEFDLEAMLDGQVYSDFVMLWLLCHQSRVESEKPEDCWLERWVQIAKDQGTRALDTLRNGVENSIKILGGGFIAHSPNGNLRESLRTGALSVQDYYRQLLRLVYRLIFLFVAEDRDLLFSPEATSEKKEFYLNYYSVSRLRRMAENMRGTKHCDLYQGLRIVMQKFGENNGCEFLGLSVLGSFLWSKEAISELVQCEISNDDLLSAVRSLSFIIEGRMLRAIDYRNLGSEELGSVYESLLELHPVLNIEAGSFNLQVVSGHERKTTGSYYTPSSLISCLLDSALEPIINEVLKKEDPDKALLNLKVCDPACGSGHFLIAAAHRLAKRLAAIRTGDDEPSPEATRKAIRDVIGHCIYGVDINPMAVELCKVGLWMEALEPGKPLSFLEHRIKCGNSLLGTTPKLLKEGMPDAAFEPIEGDDKAFCTKLKRKNKEERQGQSSLFDQEMKPWTHLGNLAEAMINLEGIDDGTIDGIRGKQKRYEEFVKSNGYLFGMLLADAWCAAFVWEKKDKEELPYPITQDVLRKIESNPYSISKETRDEIIRIAKEYRFFHWHLAFPDIFRTPKQDEKPENMTTGWSGGFDVVLGNPPWERIKLQEKEWFAEKRPDISNATNAAKRRKMISKLEEEDPELYKAFLWDKRKAEGESTFVRLSGKYPLCGRGDVNTYALFAETFLNLINHKGYSGCILPLGIVTDDTTKHYFQYIVSNEKLVSVAGFINEKMLFPSVLHNFKFCVLILSGNKYKISGADFVFNCFDISEYREEARHVTLTADDLFLLNPNTGTCPVFFWRRSAEICKKIYKQVPILDKEEGDNPWNISFFSMFHMSNDSNIFLRHNENGYLPLYEAKMINQFNHRYSSYGLLADGERSHMLPVVKDTVLSDPKYEVEPCYYVPETEVKSKLSEIWTKNWLVGFRGIASAGLVRTMVYSFLPICGVSNSMPLVIFPKELIPYIPCYVGCMNSFVLDFIARQKLAGPNLNFFIKRQIAVIEPKIYDEECSWAKGGGLKDWITPRVIELSYTSFALKHLATDFGYKNNPFFWDNDRRFMLKCELDSCFLHLYKINRDEADYILESFSIYKQNENEEFGEYKTKKTILKIYDEMAEATRTGKPYKTRLDPPPADFRVAHNEIK